MHPKSWTLLLRNLLQGGQAIASLTTLDMTTYGHNHSQLTQVCLP